MTRCKQFRSSVNKNDYWMVSSDQSKQYGDLDTYYANRSGLATVHSTATFSHRGPSNDTTSSCPHEDPPLLLPDTVVLF